MNCRFCKYFQPWKAMSDGTASKRGDCFGVPPVPVFNAEERKVFSERPNVFADNMACRMFAAGDGGQ